MHRSASSAFLILFCFVLTACGARHVQTRVADLGTRTEWRLDREASAQQALELHPVAGGSAHIVYNVSRGSVERAWQFDATQPQRRIVKDADMSMIVVGAMTLGLTCIVESDECFGTRSGWDADGPLQKRNERATPDTRPGPLSPHRDRLTFQVTVRGFDARGQELGSYTAERQATEGRLLVGVAGYAEQLPRFPEQVRVSVALAEDAPLGLSLNAPPQATFDAAAIAGWQLYAPQWQSRTVQQKALVNVMRTQVLSGRLDDAARSRERLAELQWQPVPDFELTYASALAGARRTSEAREVLQRVIRAPEASDDTQARARQLLATL